MSASRACSPSWHLCKHFPPSPQVQGHATGPCLSAGLLQASSLLAFPLPGWDLENPVKPSTAPASGYSHHPFLLWCLSCLPFWSFSRERCSGSLWSQLPHTVGMCVCGLLPGTQYQGGSLGGAFYLGIHSTFNTYLLSTTSRETKK